MQLAFILRLAPVPLSAGRIVGQVVDVATGERVAIDGEQELVAYLRRRTADKPLKILEEEPR